MNIDAVISWVDGNDPKYQAKLQEFCDAQNINRQSAIEPTRINQNNEIYYCLAFLNKNAPWLRNIFIVTNQQTPAAVYKLQDTYFGNKIKIIDQNDLLKAAGIKTPVFNSLSVEWLIWGIPDLSEKFIYLNDDFFITKPVTAEDFFQDEQLIVRGKWKTQAKEKLLSKLKIMLAKLLKLSPPKLKTDPHRSWQETAAKLAGYKKKFYVLEHAPFALKQSYFHNYKDKNLKTFQENAKRPFRDPEHISSIPLITHLQIAKKNGIEDKNKQAIMVNGAVHSLAKIKQRLAKASKNPKICFVCMQSIDQAPLETQEYMLKWLQKCLK